MSDEAKRDFVEAVVNGEAVTLQLGRDARAIASLEAAIGAPFAAFARFRAGAWTVSDVRQVLAHAWPGTSLLHALTRSRTVEALLTARPAAVYAPLAAMLLEALVFGVDAAQSTFDDQAPF